MELKNKSYEELKELIGKIRAEMNTRPENVESARKGGLASTQDKEKLALKIKKMNEARLAKLKTRIDV